MRIAIGAPVAERAWILQRWIDHIRAQDITLMNDVVEMEIFAVYTRSEDHTYDILDANGVHVLTADYVTRPKQRIDTHRWSKAEEEYMAELRNHLLDFVSDWEPHYFFSLDTDVLIPPNTLKALLSTLISEGANAVAPLLDLEMLGGGRPHAWNFMEWEKGNDEAERHRWQGPEPVPTMPFKMDVILAAIFMDRKAMRCRWRHAPGGEDIGWARNADELGLVRYMEPRVLCPHLMNPPTP